MIMKIRIMRLEVKSLRVKKMKKRMKKTEAGMDLLWLLIPKIKMLVNYREYFSHKN